eukprot:COSAG04_NODE_360_length_15920_cov_50.432815_4_plen_48_part_00
MKGVGRRARLLAAAEAVAVFRVLRMESCSIHLFVQATRDLDCKSCFT